MSRGGDPLLIGEANDVDVESRLDAAHQEIRAVRGDEDLQAALCGKLRNVCSETPRQRGVEKSVRFVDE